MILQGTCQHIARKVKGCTQRQLRGAHSLMLGWEMPSKPVFSIMFGSNSTATLPVNMLLVRSPIFRTHGNNGL